MHDHGYPGPKKKYTLCCGISIAASDQPNLNKGWASASWERKQQIVAAHTCALGQTPNTRPQPARRASPPRLALRRLAGLRLA